ncbi:hypothetical protein [Methylobacterium sp. WL19]|uniref:hypothetical protein n=1 Tax=Methylobacterium sp. WL19 TaxID=2603896 RepID=UPI00164F4DC4|nr:hypothetical protein [Methylobacterium sp. WL19]
MTTEIDDLATRLASLSPEDAAQVHRTVSGLQAERARAEEERIAGLRAMRDLEVVIESLEFGHESNRDPRAALVLLRDAGFVRHVNLEAAYRAGYERSVYDGGGIQEIPGEDDDEYIAGRGFDLDALVKKGA